MKVWWFLQVLLFWVSCLLWEKEKPGMTVQQLHIPSPRPFQVLSHLIHEHIKVLYNWSYISIFLPLPQNSSYSKLVLFKLFIENFCEKHMFILIPEITHLLIELYSISLGKNKTTKNAMLV